MEISPNPTKKTSDSETNNIIITHPKHQTLIPSSFINAKHHLHAPPSPPLTYKECLKNHAVSIGGHALDGCGEFMPSTDTNSLKCAVCDCHRNFHRQEPDEYYSTTPHFLSFHHHSAPHMLLKNVSSRKGFRTKFSQEQKEKMQVFSEKLGWRMHKSDEVLVEEFCTEIGVNKSVLKVWMHNNKTTLGKRDNSNNNVVVTCK